MHDVNDCPEGDGRVQQAERSDSDMRALRLEAKHKSEGDERASTSEGDVKVPQAFLTVMHAVQGRGP
eukprot:1139488-Pelagomonas_calceolata.AAC.5